MAYNINLLQSVEVVNDYAIHFLKNCGLVKLVVLENSLSGVLYHLGRGEGT